MATGAKKKERERDGGREASEWYYFGVVTHQGKEGVRQVSPAGAAKSQLTGHAVCVVQKLHLCVCMGCVLEEVCVCVCV